MKFISRMSSNLYTLSQKHFLKHKCDSFGISKILEGIKVPFIFLLLQNLLSYRKSTYPSPLHSHPHRPAGCLSQARRFRQKEWERPSEPVLTHLSSEGLMRKWFGALGCIIWMVIIQVPTSFSRPGLFQVRDLGNAVSASHSSWPDIILNASLLNEQMNIWVNEWVSDWMNRACGETPLLYFSQQKKFSRLLH